jgi:protease-4
VEHLLDASEDPQIRAVVLRVDSPGGSVFASEEIHRAVALLREQKPVVVSMGAVAASGGYYVAAGADAIWAEPTTITGSIGVYGTHLTFDPLLDRLGVTSTTLTRGRAAGIDGLHPWDAVERDRMERQIGAFYLQFKERVAEGRGMDLEAVEAVARGRVWSGARAKEVGLIDALGGLQDAVQDARERAGVPATREITLVSYSSRGRVIDRLTAGEARATLGVALSPPNPAPTALTVPDALRAVSTWSRLADEGALYLAPELVDLGVAP